jgi:hypothetical protein
VAPGAVGCSVFDLTPRFTHPPSAGNLSERLEFSALPVGDYVVRWDYMPKVEKGRESDRIRGREIPFTVLPLSTAPQEQALVSEFLAALPSVGWVDDSARAWLPRFYGSKFLLRVYMRTACRLNELDFDEIWNGVKRAGASPERCASLLALRLSLTDTAGHFTPEWKERIAPTLTSQIERDVLTIVPRKPTAPNKAVSGQ